MKSLFLSLIAIGHLLFLPPQAIFAGTLPAGTLPDSIDFFTSKGFKGEFIETHDPRYIVLKLDSGQSITSIYDNIDWETLHSWEKQLRSDGKRREILLTYTNKDGVMVEDQKTGVRFRLIGVVNPHPIDLAENNDPTNLFGCTAGYTHCRELARIAWESEMVRAYRDLGGDNNPALKASQLCWAKYRDAELEHIISQSSKMTGSIWSILNINLFVDLTKDRANLLKSIHGNTLAFF